MSPEVAKLAYRAIIDYMGGDIKRYIELVNKVMAMYKQVYVCECGGQLLEGKYGHGKEKKDAMICFECGQIYINGEKVRKVRGKRIC